MARTPKPTDIWPSDRRPWAAVWRDHGRVAKESVAFVSHRLGTTLLVWLLIGIALALPAALYLVETNLAHLAGDWHGRAGFTVYFRPGADAEKPAALARRLAQQGGVEDVRLITPAEALAEFRSQPAAASALALLDHNPLPATLRVMVATELSAARLTQLAALAERNADVDDVAVERTWLERLAAIRAVVERLSLAVAALLGLGVVLVASASVRLAIEARLAELRVLNLVGASRRFTRRPFLYLGALYGVGGTVVAAMLMSAALAWVEAPLERLIGAYGNDLELVGFDPIFLIGMLVGGALLGVAGALVASSQRLKHLTVD